MYRNGNNMRLKYVGQATKLSLRHGAILFIELASDSHELAEKHHTSNMPRMLDGTMADFFHVSACIETPRRSTR
jgi:hypothetical protein